VDAALRRASAATSAQATGFAGYYDAGIARGWNLYLLHRHFPERAAKLPPAAIERLLAPMRDNTYNTLSSALAMLALEAYGAAQEPVPPPGIEAVGADNRARAIGEVTGLLRRATFSAGDRSLRIVPAAGVTAWYALAQNGFDLEPGPAVQDKGLEVVREYLDADGKPVSEVALGAEVTVRLRVRALGADARGNIAIVDLLPGGFETVMQLPASGDEDGDAQPPAATLALPGSSFVPEHVEPREDRVVLYGSVGRDAREFRYRIRATNAGRYTVPPIHAESMYERAIRAEGSPGTVLQVRAAAAEPAAP